MNPDKNAIDINTNIIQPNTTKIFNSKLKSLNFILSIISYYAFPFLHQHNS